MAGSDESEPDRCPGKCCDQRCVVPQASEHVDRALGFEGHAAEDSADEPVLQFPVVQFAVSNSARTYATLM